MSFFIKRALVMKIIFRKAIISLGHNPLFRRGFVSVYSLIASIFVKKILEIEGVYTVYFKGSFARNEISPGFSDIDICVILEPDVSWKTFRKNVLEISSLKGKLLFLIIGEVEFFSQTDFNSIEFNHYKKFYSWRKWDAKEPLPIENLTLKDKVDFELFKYSFHFPYYKGYVHDKRVYTRFLKAALERLEHSNESTNDLSELCFSMISVFEKQFDTYENYPDAKIVLKSFGPYSPMIENQVIEFYKVNTIEELKNYYPYILLDDTKIIPTPTYLGPKAMSYIENCWIDFDIDKFKLIHRFQWRSLLAQAVKFNNKVFISALCAQLIDCESEDLSEFYIKLNSFFK